MSSTNDELKNVLYNIQRALIQEKELFGDTLYLEPEKKELEEQPMPARKKTIVAEEGPDLFGFAAPKAPPEQEQLPSYPNEPWVSASSLAELDSMICDCVKCPLGQTRTKFVFGVGNPNADIVMIGEAPGADEDAQGEPFVGRAGQLLNKILEAIRFKREDVYICNILKCRPPNNRDPEAVEIDTCEPYLWKQLELIKPKIIVCLGRIAAITLLRITDSLNNMRGKIYMYRGIKVLVTYHPAALLRNPHWKKPTWEDVQFLRKIYDEMKVAENTGLS
jgi:uracil-DNA glycosylase family 4